MSKVENINEDMKKMEKVEIVEKVQPKKEEIEKKSPSLSEFWSDADFIDFLKKVSVFCSKDSSSEAIESLGTYKVLYQNLYGLREQFRKFKQIKSPEKTQSEDSESDHQCACDSSQKENFNFNQNNLLSETSEEKETPSPVVKNLMARKQFQDCKYFIVILSISRKS